VIPRSIVSNFISIILAASPNCFSSATLACFGQVQNGIPFVRHFKKGVALDNFWLVGPPPIDEIHTEPRRKRATIIQLEI
jgi:hypothetical protein